MLNDVRGICPWLLFQCVYMFCACELEYKKRLSAGDKMAELWQHKMTADSSLIATLGISMCVPLVGSIQYFLLTPSLPVSKYWRSLWVQWSMQLVLCYQIDPLNLPFLALEIQKGFEACVVYVWHASTWQPLIPVFLSLCFSPLLSRLPLPPVLHL